MGNFLCFDLGTTKIKSALVDFNGHIIYSSEEKSKTYNDNKGVYQNPEDYFNNVLEAIDKIKKEAKFEFIDVDCFICSGQMGGVLGIDKNWNVIFPWSYSVDTGYNRYLSNIEEKFGKEIRKKSGGTPTIAGKILWIKNEFPQEYEKVSKFINLMSYVSGRICGLKGNDAFIDYSCLTMTGLANIKEGRWDKDICKKIGCDINKLPKIVRLYEVVGYINKNVFDTKKDIKVLAGCGDQVSGFLGAGIINDGDIVDVSGTYVVLGYCTNKYISDTEDKIIHSIYSGISDIYYQIAIVSVGGYTYKWFIEHFSYGKKLKRNFKLEKAKDLYFIPHFGGRISPTQTYFKGAFIGIDWKHDLDSFYLSMLEANGYEFNYLLEIIKKNNGLDSDIFNKIIVIGGGSENKVENQIKANILNLKYIKPNKLPFEIIGNFLVAKYRKDVKKGYNELLKNRIVWKEYILEPEHEKVKFYDKKKKKYIKIINKLDELFQEINY